MHGAEAARGNGRGRLGRAVLCVLAMACLVGTAHAEIVQTIELDGVSISIDSPWPSNLLAGWFPVTVRAKSLSEEQVDLRFDVSEAYSQGGAMSGQMRLGAGETATRTWLIPVHPANSRTNYYLTVHSSDGETGTAGLQSPRTANTLDDSYTLMSGAVDLPMSHGASHITHAQLPTDWRAYTSLGRMVLITKHGLPRAEVLEAIRAWVAAGGVLQVVGPVEGLGFALEDRFDRMAERRQKWVEGEELPDRELAPRDLLSEHRYGFGTVQVTRNPRSDLTPNWGSANWVPGNTSVRVSLPGVFPANLASLWTPIPGLSALPIGWLTAILVLFYLVMGPFQFTWLRRRKAPPSRLLITTPLLGLGFAAMLLVASLIAQGLGVKQAVSSVAWLDQQTHHVSVLAKRTVYSGSVFDTALRYDAGSAVANLTPPNHGQAYQVDLDRQVLSGAFLPVRTPSAELLLRSTTARQRVAIEKEGGRLFAVSGFETDLFDFWYRDEGGDIFRAEGGVPAGERVALEASGVSNHRLSMGLLPLSANPFQGQALVESPSAPGWALLDQLPQGLPLRTYAALMDESPFLDDGGVPRDTVAARHLLVGVLEPAP